MMLGIESYNPHFYSSTKDILVDLGPCLENLIGKKILDIWTVYDTKNNEWFKDCPVVLNIKNIELIEYNYQTEIIFSKDNPKSLGTKHSTWILNGIGFELENGYFSVYNGLDENEISIKSDVNSTIRKFNVSNM